MYFCFFYALFPVSEEINRYYKWIVFVNNINDVILKKIPSAITFSILIAITFTFLGFSTTQEAYAATFTAVQDGDSDDPNTWGGSYSNH